MPIDSTETDQVLLLASLAMRLGTINRGLRREDGQWESDTDHSIQLAWLACSIANRWYPHLDRGLIAQFAVVHDAQEVHAGDTYAVGLSQEQWEEKQVRESSARSKLRAELPALGWLAEAAERYERREDPEAVFVWVIDKLAPRISHVLAPGNIEELLSRTTPRQRCAFLDREDQEMLERAAMFPELLELRDLWMPPLPPTGLRRWLPLLLGAATVANLMYVVSVPPHHGWWWPGIVAVCSLVGWYAGLLVMLRKF